MATGGREFDRVPRPPARLRSDLNLVVTHLLGSTRSYLLQLEGFQAELDELRDGRTTDVDARLRTLLDDQPGSLRDLEQRAHRLLRSIREIKDTTT